MKSLQKLSKSFFALMLIFTAFTFSNCANTGRGLEKDFEENKEEVGEEMEETGEDMQNK